MLPASIMHALRILRPQSRFNCSPGVAVPRSGNDSESEELDHAGALAVMSLHLYLAGRQDLVSVQMANMLAIRLCYLSLAASCATPVSTCL